MFVKKSNILTSEHLIAVAVEPVLFDTILAIAKDAQAGRQEAIDALESLGYAVNPLTNRIEPTLQARQIISAEQRAGREEERAVSAEERAVSAEERAVSKGAREQAIFEREETEAFAQRLATNAFSALTTDPQANADFIQQLAIESGIPVGTLMAEINELQHSDQRDQLEILKLEADLANSTDPLKRRLLLAQISQAEANVAKTIQDTSGTTDVRQIGGVTYTPDPNLSQGQSDKIRVIETGLNFVDQAERLYSQAVGEEYKGLGSGVLSRLKGITRFLGVTTGVNESFAIYERFLDSNRATIAKGIKGEVGNLAKDEQKNALKSFPGKFSSPKEADAAFDNIRSQMTNQLSALGTFNGTPQLGGLNLEDEFNQFITQ